MHLFPFPRASRSRVALHPNWGVKGGRHHFRVGALPRVALPPLQDAGGAKEGGALLLGLPLPRSHRCCAQGRMGAPIPIPERAPVPPFARKRGQGAAHPSCVRAWSPPPRPGCAPPWPCASQPPPFARPPVSA